MIAPSSRPADEMDLLIEVRRILDSSTDLRNVVEPVLGVIARRMGMLRGAMTLLDREMGESTIEAAYGLSPSQRRRGRSSRACRSRGRSRDRPTPPDLWGKRLSRSRQVSLPAPAPSFRKGLSAVHRN